MERLSSHGRKSVGSTVRPTTKRLIIRRILRMEFIRRKVTLPNVAVRLIGGRIITFSLDVYSVKA